MIRFLKLLRKYPFSILLVFALAFSTGPANAEEDTADAIAGAMKTLDKWMLAFNARNLKAWAATVHYPHVRFASGTMTIFDSAEQFTDRDVFTYLTANGWDHSHWIERKVSLSSADKVHIDTVFERFNPENESIGVYQSLYILTLEKGRWGIKARSSLAP